MRRLTLPALLLLAAGSLAAQEPARSPHGSLTLSCATCHQPESWTVIRISEGFDHGATAFALSGAHRAVPCRACHASLDFGSAPSDCAACHADEHRGELGPGCGSCHTDRGFADRVGMTRAHQLTRFALTGGHLAVDCVSCHQPRAQGQPQYVGTPTDCVSCHAAEYAAAPNHAAAPFPVTCEECHRTVSWSAAGVTAHPTVPVALTGVHSGNLLGCTECHTSTPYSAVARTCDGCHQDDYLATSDPPHTATGFGTDCATCHPLVAGWAGATFDHPATPIALSGVHSGNLLACTECHTTTPYSTVPRTCDGCHHADYLAATDPVHGDAGFGTDCAACHPLVAGWEGATFDHPTTPVGLSGVHSATLLACTDCHATMPYSSVPQTCDGCHQDDYLATRDPDHAGASFSLDCTDCHGLVAGWAGARFLAHDGGVSQFLIYSGKHLNRWDDCSDCHAPGQPYASTAALRCLDCHAEVQTGKHAGENYTPSDCVQAGCHANGSKE